jgi:tRNA wybutosine-synthesizing protein 1
MISDELRALLLKQKYKLIGRNAGVKLCTWTKHSLRGKGACYKEKFYGISSHRCLQMAPAINVCSHNCVFCWRATQFTQTKVYDPDEPAEIIDRAIDAQRMLLSGFGGFEGVDKQKLKEAYNPNQVAISLSGEPTLYPYLPELITRFMQRNFTTFVVSNGTNPQMLERIKPTQLYITLPAPNEEIYKKTCQPLIMDGWKKINESLDILHDKSARRARTVARLTLVRNINMLDPKGYAKLIEKYLPMYVEAKAYMAVGFSRQRLGMNFMPNHAEIVEFAQKLAEETGYIITDEQTPSRVVLLARDDAAAKRRLISDGEKESHR